MSLDHHISMEYFTREYEKVKDRIHPAVYVFSQNENWVCFSLFATLFFNSVRDGYQLSTLTARVAGVVVARVKIRFSLSVASSTITPPLLLS